MVRIPSLHVRDDDSDERAHPLGIRTLPRSGGSTIVTIPPDVLALVDMDVGDDVVVHATSDTISLTRLPEQDS